VTERVALVTCTSQAEGESRDPDEALLLDALAREGVEGQFVVWDDDSVDWDGYGLSVIRSTWDYTARCGEFLEWAGATPRLQNPLEVIRYSTDKHYLDQLARGGVAIIATQFVDVGSSPNFPDQPFVVKPTIGAGSIDAARYEPTERDAALDHVARLHAAGRDVMVQPYVDTVDDEGELALIFIDGQFCHAMVKAALLRTSPAERDALFLIEQMSLATADDAAVEFARRVLEASGFAPLLYARVDLVRTDSGWAVMELEMVEPSLFLSYEPATADLLARAIVQRIGQHSGT
jgi:glutathione synthase/RimK-type ligase-like ATP-grasp enzyme